MAIKLPSFDEMAEMAKNNPEALEIMRQELSREIIQNVRDESMKRRLSGLQFQIDMECQKASNPMASCIRISQMMSESLMNLQQALKGLDTSKLPVGQRAANSPLDNISADILDFTAFAQHKLELRDTKSKETDP